MSLGNVWSEGCEIETSCEISSEISTEFVIVSPGNDAWIERGYGGSGLVPDWAI